MLVTFRGESTSTLPASSTTVANFENAISTITPVKVFRRDLADDRSAMVCGSDYNKTRRVFVEFLEAKGDLPLLNFNASSAVGITQYQTSAYGAVDGVHPVWGEFKLSFRGNTTAPIRVDASAAEIEATLEALPSIGDVTVRGTQLGQCLGAKSESIFPNASRLSVWEITFNGRCARRGWDFCPNTLGDVEMLFVDVSGLQYNLSPYFRQVAPRIEVSEAAKGTSGNLLKSSRGDEVVKLNAEHLHVEDVHIGMYETQKLRCAATSSVPGNFSLSMINNRTGLWEATHNLTANSHPSILRLALESLPGIEEIILRDVSGQGEICCSAVAVSSCEWIYVDFKSNFGTLPTLEVSNEVDVHVEVEEVTKGIDSLEYAGGGHYILQHTPTIAGNYTFSISIGASSPGGENSSSPIATELSAGLVVLPAEASAPQSHFAASLRGIAGAESTFHVQARDRFGNRLGRALNNGLRSGFEVFLNGTGYKGGGRESDRSLVHATVADSYLPNTEGLYTVTYTPNIAGPHVMSILLRQSGGLLATYYARRDFTQPALGSRSWRRWPFNEPKWCVPESLTKCDSTRLDTLLSFNWGIKPPLDEDEWPNFPSDFFSVRWVGELLSPSSGVVTFTIVTDGGARMILDDVVLIDNLDGTDSDVVSGNATLIKDRLYFLVIEYVEDRDEAYFSLLWDYGGRPPVNVPKSALYYTRHIAKSPESIFIYPNTVSAKTTSAAGGGLTECTAMTECTFVITATDAYGNYRFNSGADTFEIELLGSSDWAGDGRVNDYTGGAPIVVANVTAAPVAWEYIGTTSVYFNTSALFNVSGTGFHKLLRGDVVAVGPSSPDSSPETLTVADDGAFELATGSYNFMVPLTDVYRGNDVDNIDVYRGVAGGGIARHTVKYTPLVRGFYTLDVRVPAVQEVQLVKTTVGSGRPLSGNFTLSVEAFDFSGSLIVENTAPISFDASPSDMKNHLEALSPIISCNVTGYNADPAHGASWRIEFVETYQAGDIKLLKANWDNLYGTRARVTVTELVAGVPPKSIIGAPFSTYVAPNSAVAEWSTAYGKGLVLGIAGETSFFRIVAKDAWGNTRTDAQERSRFRFLAFLASGPNDSTLLRMNSESVNSTPLAVNGSVVYAGNGEYDARFTPYASGLTTVAVVMQEIVEVQVVSWNATTEISGDKDGAVVLSLNKRKTVPLSWDATDIDMAAALSILGYGIVNVSRGIVRGSDQLAAYNAAKLRSKQLESANYVYSITFSEFVGDVPAIKIESTTSPIIDGSSSVEEVTHGTCGIIKARSGIIDRNQPLHHEELVPEVQIVRLVANSGLAGSFSLEFKGAETSLINYNATSAQMKSALEDLETIGNVDVSRHSQSAPNGYEWAVTFGIYGSKCTEVYFTNLGDQPALVAHKSSINGSAAKIGVYAGSTSRSPGGLAARDGISPFVATILPNAVSASNCTTRDESGIAGFDGLSTGYFGYETRFDIEARDTFGNIYPYGPLAEVQILDIVSNSPIHSNNATMNSIEVAMFEESVLIEYGAGISELELALEGLSKVGAVTVTTTSAKDAILGCYVNVTQGLAVVATLCDLSQYFEVGDWIRIGAPNSIDTAVFTVAHLAETPPFAITLSSQYLGESSLNVQICEHGAGKKGKRAGYRYVVEFDTLLGDLPPISLNALDAERFEVTVTYCERLRYQEIRTFKWSLNATAYGQSESRINGTFYLMYRGERTRQLPHDVSAVLLQRALEDDLPSVYGATVLKRDGPGADGAMRWLVRLDSVEGDAPELLYAEGYQLEGSAAGITVHDDTCPVAAAGVAGDWAESVAGRLGTQFVARLDGPKKVAANVTYAGFGLYMAKYTTPRLGSYELSVSATGRGGLLGEYFNNRWLYGESVLTRIDHSIDFEFSASDTITLTGRDHVSARWTGFVRASFSEVFTFYVQCNDGARLFVDGELLFDAFENEVADDMGFAEFRSNTTQALTADALVDITLEWRETTGNAVVKLLWSSASQQYSLVPSSRLFHRSDEGVIGSPFSVVPKPVKPTSPVNTEIARGTWDELVVTWNAPENDGGEAIASYKIEWWSLVDSQYGEPDVQTLLIPDSQRSGNFKLISPAGVCYPWPLPHDVDFYDLELALEFMYDIGDVTVDRPFISDDGYRAYRITFDTSVGYVGPLSVDPVQMTARICHGGGGGGVCANLSSAGNTTVLGSKILNGLDLEVAPIEKYTFTIANLFQHSTQLEGFGVRVSASNSAGFGKPSPPLHLKPWGTPEAPARIEVERVPANENSLKVYWLIMRWPYDRQSLVTHFIIEYSLSERFPENETMRLNLSLASSASRRLLDGKPNEWHEAALAELETGAPLHIRVAGRNAAGTGNFATITETPASRPAKFVDGSVSLSTLSQEESPISVGVAATSLIVSWVPPPSNSGFEVEAFLVEWWKSAGRDEVEVVAIDSESSIISGMFQLSYRGAETIHLPSDVSSRDLEDALEALPTIRDVHVERSSYSTSNVSWTVTFLAEWPAQVGAHLTIDGSGLSALNSTVRARVGYNLQAGLPGWSTTLSNVTVTLGLRTVKLVETTAQIKVYDWILLNEPYKIAKITDLLITLTEPYTSGPSGQLYGVVVGITVPGSQPSWYNSARVSAQVPVSNGKYTHPIPNLVSGEQYFVRISAFNKLGGSQPRATLPASLAPPRQSPGPPANAALLVHGGSALRVLFKHPESNGGSAITRYRIEWDTSPYFDSNAGSPLGSNTVSVDLSTQSYTDCVLKYCGYTISSLDTGVNYTARVFAANAYGYSMLSTLTSPKFEAPKEPPSSPSYVRLTALSRDSIRVTFKQDSDGGAPVTRARIDYDGVGAVAKYRGGTSSLYSKVEVQMIQTYSTSRDLRGTFRLAYGHFATADLAHDVSANTMEIALEALPTIGDVRVERSEVGYGHAWRITFLTATGADKWFGDLPPLKVSTNATALASHFVSIATAEIANPSTGSANTTLTGTSAYVRVSTLVDRYEGFAIQTVRTYAINTSLLGTWVLKFDTGSSHGIVATSPLEAGATALAVEEALEAIGTGDIQVGAAQTPTGKVYTIVFLERLGTLPSLRYDAHSLLGADKTATVGIEIAIEVAGRLPALDSPLRNEIAFDIDSLQIDDNGAYLYTLSNLYPGEPYHVTVSLWNGVRSEFGRPMYSNPSSFIPAATPNPPRSVTIAPISGSAVNISWAPPVDFSGSDIVAYHVEWDSMPAIHEVQRLDISATAEISGSFILAFGGLQTASIPVGATGTRIEAALESLPTIGDIIVDLVSTNFSDAYTVSFATNVGDLPLLSIVTDALRAADGSLVSAVAVEVVKGTLPPFNEGTIGIYTLPLGSATIDRVAEVQALEVSTAAQDKNGFFQLSFGEHASPYISHDASIEHISKALDTIKTLGPVTVTRKENAKRTTEPIQSNGTTWLVTFLPTAGNVPLLLAYTGIAAGSVASHGSLRGSSVSVAATEVIPGHLPRYFTADGLSGGLAYYARVQACTLRGCSKHVYSTFTGMPATKPPSAPLNPLVSVIGPTDLAVSWGAPLSNGGANITHYLIQYDLDTSFDESAGYSRVAVADTNFDADQARYAITLSSLTTETSYFVRVMAYNSAGYSEPVLARSKAGRPVYLIKADGQFKLKLEAHRNVEATSTFGLGVTAADVASRLMELPNCGVVTVRRWDASTRLDLTGLDTGDPYLFIYTITFVSDRDVSLSLASDTASANVSLLVKHAYESHATAPNFVVPYGPQAVKLYSVSRTNLGVTWSPPQINGGKAVEKYLIEWDSSSDFSTLRDSGTDASAIDGATAGAAVITAMEAKDYSDLSEMQYQITGLKQGRAYWVRVSAWNVLGYSDAISSFPESATPENQILGAPTRPTMNISGDDMPNRLVLSFVQPTVDARGFRITTGDSYTPSRASAYRIQWSESSAFTDGSIREYDWRALVGDESNVPLLCENLCHVEFGVEVQSVRVYSDADAPLSSGSYLLLYAGPTSTTTILSVRPGETRVGYVNVSDQYDENIEYAGNVIHEGDFVRIGGVSGALYYVNSTGVGNATIHQAYTTGFGSHIDETSGTLILRAFVVTPPSSCLSYDASPSDVKNHLYEQLDNLPFDETVLVSRESNTTTGNGYHYRVTFTGGAFSAYEVAPLEIVSRLTFSDHGLQTVCSDFKMATTVNGTSVDYRTTQVIHSVTTDIASTALTPGTPYYVRLAAINDVGVSTYADFTVYDRFGVHGALAPQAQPGLPQQVKVFAEKEAATELRVTWDNVDTDNGAPIVEFRVEYTNQTSALTTSTDWKGLIAYDVVDGSAREHIIRNLTAGTVYAVGVRAVNEVGLSPPQWYSYSENFDIKYGRQRARPTCPSTGVVQCQETSMYYIKARATPLVPRVSLAQNPKIDMAEGFTAASFVASFLDAGGRGDHVDKFLVEWDNSEFFTSSAYQSSEVKANATALPRVRQHLNMTCTTCMGRVYFVRVSAHNSLGYSNVSDALEVTPMKSPDPPFAPSLEALEDLSGMYSLQDIGSKLLLRWSRPIKDNVDAYGTGGSEIIAYLIEYSRISFEQYVPQVQRIQIAGIQAGRSIGGTFRLSFNSSEDKNAPIKTFARSSQIYLHNATAYDVEIALENMENVGDVAVARYVSGSGDAFTYDVTFLSAVAPTSLLQAYSVGLIYEDTGERIDANLFNITEMQNATIPSGADYRQITIPVHPGDDAHFLYLLGSSDVVPQPPLLPGIVPCDGCAFCVIKLVVSSLLSILSL